MALKKGRLSSKAALCINNLQKKIDFFKRHSHLGAIAIGGKRKCVARNAWRDGFMARGGDVNC